MARNPERQDFDATPAPASPAMRPNPLAALGPMIQNLRGTIQGLVDKLPEQLRQIVVYASALVVVIVLIIIVALQFPAPDASVTIIDQSSDTTPFDQDDLILPPLPLRYEQGEYQAAFPSKPRWDLDDWRAYLPPRDELLRQNLETARSKEFQDLLENIPEL